MSKIKKIIIFVIMLLMVFTINSYAAEDISCTSIESAAQTFRQTGEKEAEKQLKDVETSDITEPIVLVSKMLTTIGILVIGCVIVILGIQWVMAKPSPEEQARLKKKFVGVAISAGVLFGAYTIWTIIVTIMDSVDG
ncbi:MAG: hypothetical protein J6J60_06765 [Clostridia bacterium]|nr:hypothetical protein [Clostridia bacterium]